MSKVVSDRKSRVIDYIEGALSIFDFCGIFGLGQHNMIRPKPIENAVLRHVRPSRRIYRVVNGSGKQVVTHTVSNG